MNTLNRHGVQKVPLEPAFPATHYQASAFKDPEVLHRSEPGHVGKGRGKLGHGLAILYIELIDQFSTIQVRQGLENKLHMPI